MSDLPPADQKSSRMRTGDFDSKSEPSASGSRSDALVGTTLVGRFKILEPIARGGMGAVYKAEQLALGRLCAVKTMLPTFDEELSEEFHRRFFNEAAVAARLTHPNTVTVYDYGHEGELYFIAMEYIVGKTLKDVLAAEGSLPPLRAMLIAMEIARSLREAHSLGVVHRDLKPANVAIVDHHDEQDTIKVLDFGLVKNVKASGADTLTSGAVCVGSPSYMAPEQVDGEEVSLATDIYSLGVVLFEMLCGRPPFVKSSKYALVMAHLTEEPPPLTEFIPAASIPTGLDDVVARCLEKAPKDRFSSLDEFLAELSRIGKGQTPLSTTTMQLRRTGSGAHGRAQREPFPSATSTGASVIVSSDGHELKSFKTGLWVGLGVVFLLVVGVATHFAMGAEESEAVALSAATFGSMASVVPVPAARPEPSGEPTTAGPTPSSRKVHISSTPKGAKVKAGDDVLCESTPCYAKLPVGQEREVTLSLPGYRTTSVEIATSEESVEVELRRVVAGPPPRPKKPPPKTGDGDFGLSPY